MLTKLLSTYTKHWEAEDNSKRNVIMISPLAHIDPSAKIGKNVIIHPFAFISKNVEIGDDCEIYPFVSLLNGTRIGERTKIYNGAIIGAEPQDFHWKGEPSYCYIGSDCKIREHAIIRRGLTPDGATRIGNKVFIMSECNIGHDSEIADRCVLGNGVSIAGNCKVDTCSILSSGVILHNASEVGKWCMIKGGCRISGNVPPYVIMAHNPVTYFGVNAFIMRYQKFDEETIDNVAKAYRHIYQCSVSVFNALKRIEQDIEPSKERDEIVNFIRNHNLDIVAIDRNSMIID